MPQSAIVYLNSEFVPLSEAKISVLDRGFLFGDGVYEVIPVYGGKLFRLEHHLARLEDSLLHIHMFSPMSHSRWRDILNELVLCNGAGDQSIYLEITRGVAPRDHAFPINIPPTVFVMSTPLPTSSPAIADEGASAITVDDVRWNRCNVKAITLLPNVLARQEAIDNNSIEALFIRDEQVIEGAASNVFIVKQRTLYTPPKGPQLLPGITRDLILELAATHHIPFREMAFDRATLYAADEVWITNSIREIVPITHVDKRSIGTGRPGPMWSRMLTLFQDYKQQVRTGAV